MLLQGNCSTLHCAKWRQPSCRAARTRVQRPVCATLVKICGVTTPEDADYAARSGANFVGMILWPNTKRAVSIETARSIAEAARRHGAEPVAVFVDETAQRIQEVCEQTTIRIVQLHGHPARQALPNIPSTLEVIYVMHADKDAKIQTQLPAEVASEVGQSLHRQVEYILVDSLKGGSGMAFDWSQLQPPTAVASKGWILAGGLKPANVSTALQMCSPDGVDVSSGVAGPDGVAKDLRLVLQFIEGAKQANTAQL